MLPAPSTAITNQSRYCAQQNFMNNSPYIRIIINPCLAETQLAPGSNAGEIPVDSGEFNQKVDDTLQTIEDALESSDADLDWDIVGGILTIECANGSQVIVNRQGPSQQIWVAARAGGFHFDYDAASDCWKQGELELFALLNQSLSEQSGDSVKLD